MSEMSFPEPDAAAGTPHRRTGRAGAVTANRGRRTAAADAGEKRERDGRTTDQ